MIDQLDSLERPICSTRRKLLKAIGGFSALAALPNSSFAKLHDRKDQSLSLLNLHTGESIKSTFIANGDFQRSSLTELDYLLRDHRNDQIHQMDTSLLMLLHELQDTFGQHKPIHVISAYRSPATNAMLSQKSNKVAKKSYHMKGMAIDIRIPGVPLRELHKASLAMKSGGVGLYTRSNFVHLDVGRVRRWGA
ncbi:DUF882 domain-containing protein [uncultured Neptuniibacter sp.]|uniref:DUF882 domain-containing protein n=1 Tax=uncultured Neptuniibacter sp. TaxID=502143 RepID=UPI002626E87E|nr:DUF882 domain-containing protein [uncultured Neptuniibacter sp.]